jgi:hypothetical protein
MEFSGWRNLFAGRCRRPEDFGECRYLHIYGRSIRNRAEVDINGRAVVIRALLPNPDKAATRPFSRVGLIVDSQARIARAESAIVPRRSAFRISGDATTLLTESTANARTRASKSVRPQTRRPRHLPAS